MRGKQLPSEWFAPIRQEIESMRADLRQEKAEMHRQYVELLKDSQRLDWLLYHGLVFHMRHGVAGLGTMDREGIDAAMGEQG